MLVWRPKLAEPSSALAAERDASGLLPRQDAFAKPATTSQAKRFSKSQRAGKHVSLPSLFPTDSDRSQTAKMSTPHWHHHLPPCRHSGQEEQRTQDPAGDIPKKSEDITRVMRSSSSHAQYLQPSKLHGNGKAFSDSDRAYHQEESSFKLMPTKAQIPCPLSRFAIFFVGIYQVTLSPLKKWLFLGSGCCRFKPTCSEYTIIALRTHGFGKGLWLSTRRILSCNPFGRHGYDPVPPKD